MYATFNDRIKNWLSRTSSTRGLNGNTWKLLFAKPVWAEDCSEHAGTDGTVTLKWILEKMLAGADWTHGLRSTAGCVLLWTPSTAGCIRNGEFDQLSVLLASQEGLRPMSFLIHEVSTLGGVFRCHHTHRYLITFYYNILGPVPTRFACQLRRGGTRFLPILVGAKYLQTAICYYTFTNIGVQRVL